MTSVAEAVNPPSGTSGQRPEIRITGAHKSFAGRVVVDINDLVLGRHPIEGLIGPNGAGKTTLMRLIMRSLPLDGGSIVIHRPGRSEVMLSRLPAHRVVRHGVVKTNQVVTDFDGMTILDSLLLAITDDRFERPHRLGGERDLYKRHREEVAHYLDIFELREPRRFAKSAGERKLVDLIRCLLLRPSFLLLDEPTAGLPLEVTDRVVTAVKELAARGSSVVIIEHDLDVIWELCTQVTFMAEGKVMLQGEPAEIREHSTVVESYLGQGHV